MIHQITRLQDHYIKQSIFENDRGDSEYHRGMAYAYALVSSHLTALLGGRVPDLPSLPRFRNEDYVKYGSFTGQIVASIWSSSMGEWRYTLDDPITGLSRYESELSPA